MRLLSISMVAGVAFGSPLYGAFDAVSMFRYLLPDE